MRLASDNSLARRCLKHLSWRSRWIIMCTLEGRMALSCEIARVIGTFLVCLPVPDWVRGPPQLLYATNALCRCLIAEHCTRLEDSLQQTVGACQFRTLVGKFTQQPSCTILLWQIEIFNQNRIFLWHFHDFV